MIVSSVGIINYNTTNLRSRLVFDPNYRLLNIHANILHNQIPDDLNIINLLYMNFIYIYSISIKFLFVSLLKKLNSFKKKKNFEILLRKTRILQPLCPFCPSLTCMRLWLSWCGQRLNGSTAQRQVREWTYVLFLTHVQHISIRIRGADKVDGKTYP